MELSLDEIIQKKRFGDKPKVAKKPLPLRKTIKKVIVRDARLKIIQNNRAKIRDARDRLAEITRANGDARIRLVQKQLAAGALINNGKDNYRNRRVRSRTPTRKISNGPKFKVGNYRTSGLTTRRISRRTDLVDVPRGYVDYDNMERMEEEEYATSARLSRTVKNDMAHFDTYETSRAEPMSQAPPAPRHLNSWSSTSTPDHFDPFDVYELPRKHIERRVSTDRPLPTPKNVLRPNVRQRSPVDLYDRRYVSEIPSHLSYEMRARLERAPDPHASMGIFSNPLKSSPPQMNLSSGHRIVVSNLHNSVTEADIKELFEDVGELYDSHIVRPGVAEVIYKSLEDAETAVDTYHNRQLDGQPMKCLLVNARSSNKPTAPAIKSSGSSSRTTAGKTPLEIDIDALHKVLFRRN